MTSSSTLAIENLSLGKKVNWLLLAAVALTLMNGVVISRVILPAVSGPAEVVTGYSDGWAEVAENLVQGNGFVFNPELATYATYQTGHIKREPAYPLFLAFILAVFGKLDPYMMLFQILINSLT